MTKRIFRSIFLVAMAVLLASVSLIMAVLYAYFTQQYQQELKTESVYITEGMEGTGQAYLNSLKTHDGTRITWIDGDGTVLYDNEADPAKMGNHANREEIQQALKTGHGECTRYSKTMSEKTIYYAVKLTDGTVLRVSGTQYTILTLLLTMLEPILIVFAIALILSLFLSYRVAKKAVQPLNEIDLDHPEQAQTFEELSPMLRKIAVQNRQIKKQMSELHHRQEEFTAITENMQEGLLVLDPHMDILSCNHSAARMLHADHVADGENILTLNRETAFRETIESTLAGQHQEQILNMGERLFQLIANPVWEEGKVSGIVLLLMDVTEREEREKLRREFTANVSHELKTPLTSISGFAEIIQNGLVKPEDISRFAGNIYQESQRLITLIGDIIRLSQLDEENYQTEKTKVNLKDFVEKTVDRLCLAAKEKNLTVEVSARDGIIEGVPAILQEMIYNLCDNAVKYNRENGKLTVSLKTEGDQVIFSVRDTGIGIPKEEQSRIFERFYRVDKSHSKEIGGTGLGLSIVKHGALIHKAKITVDSESGQGTEIRLIFPAA